MNIDNSLTQKFLTRYPTEAARVLEQVSINDIAALFNDLSVQTGAPILAAMLPSVSAACLELTKISLATKLLTEMPVSSAARIFRLLKPNKQDELSGNLSAKTRKQFRDYLEYPATSVGALLDHSIDMLPVDLTVAEALRRIQHPGRAINCELYIVDESHQLLGFIELGQLLTSDHHARLHDIMNRNIQPVSVYSMADSLLIHPAWSTHHRLPVVERDNTLLGVLEFRHLQESVGDSGTSVTRDPMGNFLSLASLYWISLAQLLDSLFGNKQPQTRIEK